MPLNKANHNYLSNFKHPDMIFTSKEVKKTMGSTPLPNTSLKNAKAERKTTELTSLGTVRVISASCIAHMLNRNC